VINNLSELEFMNSTKKSAVMLIAKRASLLLALLAVFLASASQPIQSSEFQSPTPQSPAAKPGDARACHAEGKLEISIACDYADSAAADSGVHSEPRIILDRAKLWFRAKDDSHMRIELTFTNRGARAISEARTVYIEIDDKSGQNYIRRPLPTVDFKKLEPGEPITFSETLRAPAFQPGAYTIYLWIPSADPSLKFEPTRNFLLGNSEVPDEKSGLNAIATFLVLSRN
jgi:hypothetical protein